MKEQELYKTLADWFNYSEEDYEFIRQIEESEKKFKLENQRDRDILKLMEIGNFSEAEKLENFTTEEWQKWKEAEQQKIESLEKAVNKKNK